MAYSSCPQCGAESFEVIEQKFHFLHMRCFTCGHEESGTSYPTPTEADRAATIHASQRATAFLVWEKGRPTPAEIVNARHIAQALQDRPLSELQILFNKSCRFKLGEFFIWQIEDMKKKAEKFSMFIEME